MRYLRFGKWLDQTLEITGGIDAIHYEEVRQQAGTDASHVYGGPFYGDPFDREAVLKVEIESAPTAEMIAAVDLDTGWPEGQLPFAGARKAKHHDDRIVSDIQTWIASNYHLTNPVTRMVEQSGLSERTFTRRFRNATGYSPMEYIQTLRIEEAKHLLETTASSVEMIAVETGYEDPNFFRRLFKRKVGITPARYRQRFAAILKR
jgi:AraC-like DNA-binding protein